MLLFVLFVLFVFSKTVYTFSYSQTQTEDRVCNTWKSHVRESG